MTAPETPPNPYAAPQVDCQIEEPVADPFAEAYQHYLREKRTLAASWLFIGFLMFFFGLISGHSLLLGLVAKIAYTSLGAGWMICGLASFRWAIPWVDRGLKLCWLIIGVNLMVGLALTFRDRFLQFDGLVMQVVNLIPLLMLRQAYRVRRWAGQFVGLASPDFMS